MKSPIYLLLLFICIFPSCTTDKPEEESFDTERALELFKEDIESRTAYFFEKNKILHEIERIINHDTTFFESVTWVDTVYHKQQEIIFSLLNADDFSEYTIADSIEAYRLEVDRSFSDEVILLTAQNKKGEKKLIVQSYFKDPECNFYVGTRTFDSTCVRLLKNKEKTLSDLQWKRLIDEVEKNEFWGLQGNIYEDGLDGSWWTLEGTKKDYSSWPGQHGWIQKNWEIYRWAPKTYQGIYQIGMELMRLSGEDWGEM